MDISIIVPVHNLEHYIQPLLSTLWNQNVDGLDVEYIFVFDKCTDNSKEVVASWATKMLENGKASSIHFVDSDFGRPGLARNTGLDRAVGEYIWFIDGDDWLISEIAIKRVLDVAKNNDLDLLRFDFMSLYKLYQKQDGAGWMCVWRYIYRRSFLSGLSFNSKKNEEDNDFSLDVLKKVGYRVPEIKDVLYFYNYDRTGSLTYPLLHPHGG